MVKNIFQIINEICANKPHRLKRHEAMGGMTEKLQTEQPYRRTS